jgi:hypothetical protein
LALTARQSVCRRRQLQRETPQRVRR